MQVRLELWSEKTKLGNAFQTPGIVFSPTDAVIPDLIWISRERLSSSVDGAGHLTVAPELVIEVLSSGELNEQRDKEVKLKLYSQYGVREYWIVSWQTENFGSLSPQRDSASTGQNPISRGYSHLATTP